MKLKKMNYNDVVKKLDDYLKKADNGYMVIFITPEGDRYKVEQSNGRTTKVLYFDTEKELREYLKEKEQNPNCHVIICDIV